MAEEFKGFQLEGEKKQFFDHMNLKENKDITDQLDDGERIIFSILTKKGAKLSAPTFSYRLWKKSRRTG